MASALVIGWPSSSKGQKDETSMNRDIQISLENDAHHRALRRCYSCGAYARPFDEVNGAIRCWRCAEKARREREEAEDLNATISLR